MMKALAPFLCVLALGTLADRASAQSITTLFAHNNYGNIDGANYFDVTVTNALTVTMLDVNCGPLSFVGSQFGVDVYTAPSTAAGKQTNMSLWTLVGSGTGIVAPSDTPVPVDVSDFPLAPGSYGIAIVFTGGTANLGYTNGTGGNQNYSNADLALVLGSATNIP
ncbi:MAG TPA: hypothetical protein VMS76_15435, partial [Planctomycetota bacterium]|nr:hypothetical protein [Planctomycetota bacterium]